PIAEWSSTIAAKPSHLFPVRRATLMHYWEDVSNTGQGMYTAENPTDGAVFTYYLGRPAQRVRFTVRGPAGQVIREIDARASPCARHVAARPLRRARNISCDARRRWRHDVTHLRGAERSHASGHARAAQGPR